ncbi:hypothetical protein BURKHO8Y_510021 [Burkholderia sp. 8Y]|nr:hypothetical protein BURKHO8Y_510021 [Burkholderia sp. 8Y]
MYAESIQQTGRPGSYPSTVLFWERLPSEDMNGGMPSESRDGKQQPWTQVHDLRHRSSDRFFNIYSEHGVERQLGPLSHQGGNGESNSRMREAARIQRQHESERSPAFTLGTGRDGSPALPEPFFRRARSDL